MYIPTPYFSNIPQLGNLTLDYILVEDGYPVLFTCKNEHKIYICLCRTLVPEQKWIISETSISILKKMVQGEIPICKAFSMLGTKSCIVRWSKDNPVERYSIFSTLDLQKSDLPDETIFLDEDDAEDAIDYVESLSREAALQAVRKIDEKLSSEYDIIGTAGQKIKSRISYGFATYPHLFEQFTDVGDFLTTTSPLAYSSEANKHVVPRIDATKESVINALTMGISSAA